MTIESIADKNKVAIVTVGFNRVKSMQRLLESLLKADYSKYPDVPLVISIDCSGDEVLYKYVREFNWPYGKKYVRIQEKRLGLKEHILSCGDLTKYFKGVILLEDDIFVTPNFYNYTVQAIDYYDNEPKIASISLYNDEMNGFCWLPFSKLHKEADVYTFQGVFSWGECWTERMWGDFRKWMESTTIDWNAVDMPPQISQWTRAWSKFYHAYMVLNDLYSLCPYVSLTTNFSDAGEHGGDNNTIVQVNLQYGYKEYTFRPFDELVHYDAYSNNNDLYEHLQLPKTELCVDLFGERDNRFNKRYYLSVKSLPYKVIRSFGLFLRPQELNVLYGIEGNDIFLYDTQEKGNKPRSKGMSNRLMYYLHGMGYGKGVINLYRVSWGQTKSLIRMAWKKYVVK